MTTANEPQSDRRVDPEVGRSHTHWIAALAQSGPLVAMLDERLLWLTAGFLARPAIRCDVLLLLFDRLIEIAEKVEVEGRRTLGRDMRAVARVVGDEAARRAGS